MAENLKQNFETNPSSVKFEPTIALTDITNIKGKKATINQIETDESFTKIPKIKIDTCESTQSQSKMFYKIDNESTYEVVSPRRSLCSSMNSLSDGFLPVKSLETPIYTLVLDLDETLIHFADDVERNELLDQKHMLQYKIARKQIYRVADDGIDQYFHIRPYATKLLSELSKYFEIVIFTAGIKEYADAILDELHCSKYISHRLYRHHTMMDGDVYIKDLGLIGRDITKTLIVDNTKDNFMYHNRNGIPIHSWYEDQKDSTLNDLTKILASLAEAGPKDIRKALEPWRPVIEKYIQHGISVPEYLFELI